MDNMMGKYRQNLNDFLDEAELQQYSDLFRDILKITKVSQLKFVVSDDLEQIGLSKPEQRRYKKVFNKYFPNPYIYKLRKLLSYRKNEPAQASVQPVEYQAFHESNVKVPTKHIISIEDITINKELGKGQFGVVQQGTWTAGSQRHQVAIKCLGQERMTSNSAEFLKEAAVMHSIEHQNIVRLYGVVLHSDSLMLVTELAPLRSLLECLREVSLRTIFTVANLCEFAEQICDGMTYLETKRLIHRDLAARNILVFSKDLVKISDFGLSRALGVGKDYYQTNYNVNLKLPVAWCAPECILYLRFTSASDVWAFGVCLWEIFTYGFQPWAGFSGQQILEAIDTPNLQRLERPQCCPQEYFTLMLQCWSHEPNSRPRFRELSARLRTLRPEQVVTTVHCNKSDDSRRSNYLEFKAGQVVTILGKEAMTRSPMWFGVIAGGTCGLIDPAHTRPYVPPDKALTSVSSLSPHPTRHSSRSIRSSLLRCDVKRHTYTGKRTIQRSMISYPQGEVKHTGHVGLDGAYFGDISFLDPAGCPPRQIVTPYKPSEDLEQVPLINPNSPSHLTGASGTTPYPMLTSNRPERSSREDTEPFGHRSLSESAPSARSILNKVKYATLGRSHRPETGAVPKTEEVHEYHEISDNDTSDSTVQSPVKSETGTTMTTLTTKSSTDFGQSILDEMDAMFRSLDTKRRDEPSTSSKTETVVSKRSLAIKSDKKKSSPTCTMKPMSAHDEKTLNTAVALANEITSKSMNDLGGEKPKNPNSPSDRSRFHFKFPLYLQHHGHSSHDHERDRDLVDPYKDRPEVWDTHEIVYLKGDAKYQLEASTRTHEWVEIGPLFPVRGKPERRNFSEEAKSVPDIQSSLTAESKMAYTSLIEEPTPSTSLMSHLAKETGGILKPSTIPKPASHLSHVQFHSLQKNTHMPRSQSNREDGFHHCPENPLPLPPRTTKPKLIDKPRHIRKYPLKIPGEVKPVEPCEPVPNIYQNTSQPQRRETKVRPQKQIEVKDIDVHDGPERAGKHDTNPFTSAPGPSVPRPGATDLVMPGPSGANPFTSYTFDDVDDIDADIDLEVITDESEEEANKAGALVKDCKDHVSVEDLLEFADQKPCGRQRGVESDEVRIMSKVLKQQVSPEECLEALELSSWDVHNAIKLVRVSVSVGTDISLEDCSSELAKANGDINKASAVLGSSQQKPV
ncbi:activated Cdc42 kinase-like isoform X3 [Anticarsia gemmatalis]|uniref:activated Cdc42 kinase-like isoform X3 n=1 Tax=Anticarsia gemmatalis TaxID=129554 RepID=UPI003F76F51C